MVPNDRSQPRILTLEQANALIERLNTVVGKTYDTQEGEGRVLWERVAALLRTLQPLAVAEPQSEMFGEPVLVRPRLGQGSFRVLVFLPHQWR